MSVLIGLVTAVRPSDPCHGLNATGSRPSLRQVWCNYKEAPLLHRYIETADFYEQHLPAAGTGRQLRMLEMGVQSGGSTRSWKQHYGSDLYYVGVDINPGCVRSRSEAEEIHIEIGSQVNVTFLLDVCARHGPFDVIIDDGGHSTATIKTPITAMFAKPACMKETSIYVVEDMHTMHHSGLVHKPAELHSLVGEAFWSLHHPYVAHANRYGPGNQVHPIFKDFLQHVIGYPTIAFFFHGPRTARLTPVERGTDRLPDTPDTWAYSKGLTPHAKSKVPSPTGDTGK